MVGAVQHRKVAQLFVLHAGLRQGALGAQALDAGHHALGLVVFAVGVHHAHRLALAQVAPQAFRKELGVGCDHVVGRAQDGGGRAVVLLQLDDFERRKVLRQQAQIVQSSATPAVNTLVVIAHGGKARCIAAAGQRAVGLAAHQELEHAVLGGIGVLVFIHQHVAHIALPLGTHLRVFAQQFERQADQIVKVHALVGAEALLIAAHDDGALALVLVSGDGQGLLGVQAGAFPGANRPLPVARGGRIGAAASVFEDAGDISAVQDAELRLEPQHRAVGPQHAHTERVEGANEHLLGRFADQGAGALAHFGGGFVGKGDGRNPRGRHARLDEPADFVRDHPCFSRTGAGQHQAGAVHVVDRLLLGGVHGIGGGGHTQSAGAANWRAITKAAHLNGWVAPRLP